MTNYIAFIMAILGMQPAPAPASKYEKPVNYETKLSQTYVKPVDIDQHKTKWVQVEDQHPSYEEIRFEALHSCKNNKSPSDATVKLVDQLIAIEKKHKVPGSLRGMLLAAACTESGFNPKAKGDYRKSKKTGVLKPKAIGLMQQWPWVKRFYKIDRTNPLQAADAWMKHVVRQLKSVKKECRFKTEKRRWIAAWVKSIRAPKKKGNRCGERPTHYRLLKKWHRVVTQDRREEFGC